MVNKITRKTIGEELFNQILDDIYETSSSEHRRGSGFYVTWVYEVNEEYFPDHPELWGFWESNVFIHDTEYGSDNRDIEELTRVEKVKNTVTIEEWVSVK